MVDLTSSVYSLVVLASATMGISQYFQTTQKSVFKKLQGDVKKILEGDCKELFENHTDKELIQSLKDEGDQLSNQIFPHLRVTMAGLFCMLPCAGVLQILNVIQKTWNEGIISYIAVVICVLYLITVIFIICIAIALRNNRSERIEFEKKVDQFRSSSYAANAMRK